MSRKGFWDYHVTLNEAPNGHANSLREIIMDCVPEYIKELINYFKFHP